MKFIKIFLASSIIEFKHEREEFGTFIRRLNNIYAKRDIYFELVVCEDVARELHNRRMQDIYNDEIRESRYFYIIVGRKLGERSLEEFDVALDSFVSSGVPKIMTYFYELADADNYSDSVKSFMERLDKDLGHDYNLFSHFDSIKLDFLMSMHQDPELGADISFADGEAALDGVNVMPLMNVPIYGKNKSLLELKEKKEKLDDSFAELTVRYAKKPDDKDLYNELIDISEKRAHFADALRKAENDVLSLYMNISVFKSDNHKKTWREDKAIQLVNQGDYQGALSILRDRERKSELSQAQNIISSQIDVVKGYIQENLLRIKTLRASGLNEDRILEIDECYDEIVDLSIKYHIEESTVYDYASFLLDEKSDYDKAVIVADKLYKIDHEDHIFIAARVNEIIAYAMLVGKHDLKQGREYYEKAIKYYTESGYSGKWYRLSYDYNMLSYAYAIEKDNSKALEYALKSLEAVKEYNASASDCIYVYISLAGKYDNIKDYDNAIKYSELAYELAYKKYEKNRNKYNKSIFALVCKNKGGLLKKQGKLNEAKIYYEKALELRKDIYVKNPYTSMKHLRFAYQDYACVLFSLYLYQDAVRNYRNAVEYSRKLFERNPPGEGVYLGNVLHEFGDSLNNIYKYDEALKAHREALTIRKNLLGRDDGYTSDVLYTSRMVADDLYRLEIYEEAEKYYLECIDLAEKCAEENQESYNREPNLSRRNYAWFLNNIERSDEAWNISDGLLEDEREYFANTGKRWSLAWQLNCSGCIEYELKNYDKSEEYLLEGLQILKADFEGKEKEGVLEFSKLYANLAECLYRKGDYFKALKYCEKSYEIRRQLLNDGREGMDNYMRNVYSLYANILDKMDDNEKSRSFYLEALESAEKLYEICPDAFRSSAAEIELNYAKFLMKTDRISEARIVAEKAFHHYQKLMTVCEGLYKDKFIEINGIYMEILKKM